MKRVLPLLGALALILLAAVFGYRYLSNRYAPSTDPVSSATQTPEQTQASAETQTSMETQTPEQTQTAAEMQAPTETQTPAQTPAETQVPVKTQAPEPTDVPLAADFTVYDGDGNPVLLSDFFGKPIVVNFWATWCGPCRSELASFDAAYAEYGDSVAFLMVNLTDGAQDTLEGVKSFVEKAGYTFPVYYDTAFSAVTAYGIYSIPVTAFIRADGSLMGSQIGAISSSALDANIKSLMGGDAK